MSAGKRIEKREKYTTNHTNVMIEKEIGRHRDRAGNVQPTMSLSESRKRATALFHFAMSRKRAETSRITKLSKCNVCWRKKRSEQKIMSEFG